MGRGDVISSIANVSAGSRLIFQPALGVEVMITEVDSDEWTGTYPNRTPDIDVELFDGIFRSRFREFSEATYWSGGTMKLFINNSLYLSLRNQAETPANLSYCGIQTK